MCGASISKLPDEVLHEIFLQATLIHGEWDVSTNYFHPGLFCSYDEYHLAAWEYVLPHRLNITKVCRRWHQIGVEFLYGSFHHHRRRYHSHYRHPLPLFRALLEARPEIGRLVKRLSLIFDPDDNADDIALISLCPNLIIFSSLPVYTTTHEWWTSTPFPPSLRHFDSSLSGPTWATVVAVLNNLPSLEILHLYFDGPSPVKNSNYPLLSLPALRVLQLYMHHADVTSIRTLTKSLHLPRLVALSFSSGPSMSDWTEYSSPFSTQLLGRLVSLNSWNHARATKAEDLVCLRQVIMDTIPTDDLTALVPHIPFHNVTHFVLHITSTPPTRYDIDSWLSKLYDRMSFPLVLIAMPMLRILELKWWQSRVYTVIKGHSDSAKILCLFNFLAIKFEQRGVQFIEAQRDLRKGPESIKDIVYSLQKENPSLYSRKSLEDIARSFPWGADETEP